MSKFKLFSLLLLVGLLLLAWSDQAEARGRRRCRCRWYTYHAAPVAAQPAPAAEQPAPAATEQAPQAQAPTRVYRRYSVEPGYPARGRATGGMRSGAAGGFRDATAKVRGF